VFGPTMLVTIGQALDRAKEADLTIRLHVGGEWIRGRVASNDGQGVVVVADDGDICVLRMEAITCVRLPRKDVRTAHVPTQPDRERARVPADHLPATT
jgi:hypothetical protein